MLMSRALTKVRDKKAHVLIQAGAIKGTTILQEDNEISPCSSWDMKTREPQAMPTMPVHESVESGMQTDQPVNFLAQT